MFLTKNNNKSSSDYLRSTQNLLNLSHAFYIYLVNVQTMRKFYVLLRKSVELAVIGEKIVKLALVVFKLVVGSLEYLMADTLGDIA